MAQLSEVMNGLLILSKYVDEKAHAISAEHDVIYAGPDETGEYDDDTEGVKNTVVSTEDAKRLVSLGWHIDEEVSSWARFV